MTVEKTRGRVYLDVDVEKKSLGRIIIELFDDICPKTCENFRGLCTGEYGLGKSTKLPLCYKGAPFHRIIKDFVIQGGDFESGDGTGGESIYGGQFDGENFTLKHDEPFLLSMANIVKNNTNKNGSQFFITTKPTPHLDDKHTVFGKIVSGHQVVTDIENMKVGLNHKPLKEVTIARCGELVRKSGKKRRRQSSTDSSSSSKEEKEEEEEEKKRKKTKKKHAKKHKKEKKTTKSHVTTGNKGHEDSACAIDPDEIPAVPANNFLMRRTSPVADFRRTTQRVRESFNYKRRQPSRSRSGRKIKGRGNMRYRTPSSSDERSGSETPPHWKQAQSRLKSLKDIIPKKDKESVSEMSDNNDAPDQKIPKNPFLQSRLGLVSRKGDRRRRERDSEGGWRNTEWSPESADWVHENRDSDKKPDLFKQLIDEDKRQSRQWVDVDNPEESRDADHSALKSKIVVKSGVFSRNFKDDGRNGEKGGGYRKYDESYKRRDSFPDRRSRDFRRDSSTGRDNAHKRSDDWHRSSEKKKETVKATDKPKEKSAAAQKRLNLLQNDLFRYNKDAIESDDEEPPIKKPLKKKNSAANLNLLANDLLRYNKDAVESEEEPPIKKPLKKKNSAANLNLLENDLFRYNKSALESDEDEEPPRNQKTKPESSTIKENEDFASRNAVEKDVIKDSLKDAKCEDSNISDSSPLKSPKEKSKLPLPSGIDTPEENIPPEVPAVETVKESDSPAHKSEKSNSSDLQQTVVGHTPEIISHSSETLSEPSENAAFVELNTRDEIAEVQKDIEIGEKVSTIPSPKDPEDIRNVLEEKLQKIPEHSQKVIKSTSHSHSPSPAPKPQMPIKKTGDKSSIHRSHKKRASRSPSYHKALSTRTRSQSRSPIRKSASPPSRTKPPAVSRKSKTDRGPRSNSRSSRSTSRSRVRKRYSRSPDVRQRRSRSHPRDSGRGTRSYGYSGSRKRTPERRPIERRYRGSPYRGQARGRSASKRSVSRSRSKSVDKKRRRRHQSSSSSSSSSSSRSSSVRKRNVKKQKVRRSSSSSTVTSRSKRSHSGST